MAQAYGMPQNRMEQGLISWPNQPAQPTGATAATGGGGVGGWLQPMINQLPQTLQNYQQQAQNWMGNLGQAYGGMGNVANQLQNWNAQNPYQNMLMGGLQGLGQTGFNAGQLGQFMNAFNPGSAGYGGWNNFPGGGGGMPQWMNQGTIGGMPIGGQPGPKFGGGGGYQPPMGEDPRWAGEINIPPQQGPPVLNLPGGRQIILPTGGGGPSGIAPTMPGSPAAGGGPTAGQGRQMNLGMTGGNAGMPPQPQGPTNPWGVQLNQAAPMTNLQNFINTPTNVPTPTAPNYGAGGAMMNQLFAGGTQQPGQFGGFGQDYATARNAQLQGLLGQAGGVGINPAQRQELFAAEFNPAQEAINRSAREAQAGLSARGMGRSSEALGNIESSRQQALSNAAQQVGAGLTSRGLDLAQRQAEFGLGGLGGYAQTGQAGALGAGNLGVNQQQAANQYNLGLGNLGLGGAELGAQTGLEMNRQGMQAQQQQFNQDSARAGLDLSRYQTQQGFNMDQYKSDLNAAVQKGQLDEQTAARLGQQALQTMGYGLEAQGMQNAAQQAYVNALLGAGNQALGYGGQNLQALQNAGQLYGNQAGMAGNLGMGMYGMYMDPLMNQINFQNQRGMAREQAGGGGLGGFLGGLAGLGVGSLAGGAGAALGQRWFGGG